MEYVVQNQNTITVIWYKTHLWYKTQISLGLFGTKPKYHWDYLVQNPYSIRIIWYKTQISLGLFGTKELLGIKNITITII